jgi:flagellar FliL protein
MAEDDKGEGISEGDVGLDDEGSGGGLKKIILIAVPVVLILVGAGLYFSGVLGGAKPTEEELAAQVLAEDEQKQADPEAVFLQVPDIVVNLQSEGQPHYLKLSVKLELKNNSDLEAVSAVIPRVIDRFQTFLREMRVEDLRGTAGIYRLRQELLYRVNLAAKPVVVQDVLFQDVLVQ